MNGDNVRIIGRLDIKGENLIKGINLEGLRVIGCPQDYAVNYYLQGIDELLYMDAVASLYGRNHLASLISQAVEKIFVPITVGGGIRSVDDALSILRSGADKVAVNTAAVVDPHLITDLAMRFGSQCVVLSIEAKRLEDGGWEALIDNGRERSGRRVLEWVDEAVQLGAGEILLTSVDQEGTRNGCDVALANAVSEVSSVPVVISGGVGSPNDVSDVAISANIDAVAIADLLHYKRATVRDIKNQCVEAGLNVRPFGV